MKMDLTTRTASLLICLSILLATVHNGNAERKIVCYYTNWSIYRPGTAKFSPQNINPYLCTHLIYAFGGFTKDNALKPFDKYQDIEKGGYAKFTGLKTYNKNLKTLLAIGGWNEGSSRFSPMVADQNRRREFVKNTVKFLRKNHFDGLDLDWEYPAFRDGGKPRDKENYANLVQELREEFERESSKTGRPRLLLSMAMPAGIEYIDKGYDIPRLNEYLDFINLLSYDYHSSYEPAVNHHSPLYPLEEDNEYNYDAELTIDYTVDYLLKKGASPDKIILGIPTYGRSYTLFNQDATDLGSPAEGPGIEGDATREKGYLAYYEICESLANSDEWEVVQPNPKAMGPYAFKGDQWVGYDDEDIVKLKAKYANEKNLGGIMFWTIDNDDFRGKCHDRPYPLIEAAKEALLTDSDGNVVEKSKPVNGRKRTRIEGVQSNSINRKSGSAGRRSTTTAAPVVKKRVSSPRPKYRTISRNKSQDEEEDDEEIDRRSSDRSSEEEDNSEKGNAVKNEGSGKSRPKNRSGSSRNRRKQTRRKEGNTDKTDSAEKSFNNKLTTPEPPTTPDPGTDFKCEDEGFFPHPRDCKKYFWCLDSGPGGLGVVAHQFTCPSGLVFNKAADSCDYPRNVICPKSKTSQTSASTTRAPITAATSRTTYLYSTTRRPTTEKPADDQEYEYYDDDDDDEEEEEEIVEEEKKQPKTTTTPKPLLYQTINRSRPTTTSTTTTETPSKLIDEEDEEDPRVIKELIMLIKKAGGIEELEKQLLQGKSPEEATPATISRTLYERVLSRQAGKITTKQRGSANGPGGAQFEGLDEVPEVKTLRRSNKPRYVTIERSKPSNRTPVDNEDIEEEEEDEDDIADVASSEEQTVSNPFLTSSTQRVTPNYINIRRARPSTTTSRSENDVEERNKDADENTSVRKRRPSLPSKSTENNDSSEDVKQQENSPTTKSRYVSVQRFRSTTPQPTEASTEIAPSSQEPITEQIVSSEAAKIDQNPETITTTTPLSVRSIVSSTPNDDDSETEKSILNETSSTSTESVKLVDDSATEILLTTAPASSSTLSTPNTRISSTTVSQPRPFAFNRRNRPSTDQTTTPLPASNDQTRPKVAGSPSNRLPTLKELIGYQRTNEHRADDPVLLSLFPLKIDNEKRTNFILNGDGSVSNDTTVLDPRAWTLGEIDKNKEESLDENRAKDEVDSIVDKADSYYIEDNLADDDEDASFASKKRIDRQDSTVALQPTTMRGVPLVDLLHDQVPRGFYVTKSELELRKPETIENTEVTSVVETTVEIRNTPDESETTESVTTTFAPSILSTDSTSPLFSSTFIESESSTNPVSIDSFVEESLNSNSLEHLRKTQSDSTTDSIATETESSTVFKDLNTEEQTDRDTTIVITTTLPSTTVSQKPLNRRREKIDSDFGERSRGRTRFKHREDSSKETKDTENPRRRVTIYRGRQRRPVSSSPATNYSTVKASNEEEGEQVEETTTLSSKESVTGNDRFEDEVNSSTNTPAHSPGSLLSTRLRKPAAFAPTSQQNKSSNTFTNHRKNRPTGGEHGLDGEKLDAADKTTDTPKVEKDIDQSSRAQEIATTLAEPPTSQSSTTGRPALRNAFRRKISTTIAPRTDAPPTTTPPTTTTTTTTTTKSRSSYRFTPIVRDRQKPRTKDKPVQNTTPRPKRPQVIDYDYYEDEEESVVGKSTYDGKLFLTSKGSIRCLDQGNFPHPYSCKKFITCARMVNGLVVGAEYTCPDKLSFDPVGGICNWSAGLGCND